MIEHEDQAIEEAVREAEEVRAPRAERDRRLSPEERLRRVDALCRQLASIRPVGERRRVAGLGGLVRELAEAGNTAS
jgi:hypothetical protein